MAKRPFNPRNKNKRNNSNAFQSSLLDSCGDDTALKLKRFVEDSIKRKIANAQSDPKVQEASKKYTAE